MTIPQTVPPPPVPRTPPGNTTTVYVSVPVEHRYTLAPDTAAVDKKVDDERNVIIVSAGNGGTYQANNISAEFLMPHRATPGMKLGVGAMAVFTGTDSPPDVIDGMPPHSDYTIAGKYRETTYGLYGVMSQRVWSGIQFRAMLGYAAHQETTVDRSEVTGWYYTDSSRSVGTMVMGAGVIIGSSINLNYDNVRGLSLGMVIPLR